MPTVFYILLGPALTIGASVGLGRVLLGRRMLPLYRQERLVFEFLVGAALLSLVVFAMATAHVVYKGTILTVAAAAMIAGWRAPRPVDPSLPPLGRWAWLGAVALPIAAYSLANAMAPENSPDGIAYHLGLVSRYYREHGFGWITTNMYAHLSQGAEMLFLFSFGFGRHSGAAVTHLAFCPALGWLVVCYGRRHGFPQAGLCAALFVVLSPLVAVDASIAYNDVAAATVGFAAFYLLEIWRDQRHNSLLAPIGLLAGFSFAIKYTGFPALLLAAGYLAWKRAPRRAWVVVGLAAALMIGPWLVKNTVVAGNPVAPFFNRWFPNPNVHISFERDYKRNMRTYNLPDLRQVPFEVIFRGHLLSGFLGPLFFLSPLALVGHRRAMLAAAVFAIAYPNNIGARFLLPVLPLVSLSMAYALRSRPRLLAGLVVAHAVAGLPAVQPLYCDRYAWRLDEFPIRAALRLDAEHDYLSAKSPAYLVARMLEDLTPRGSRALATNSGGEAYTSREMIVVHQSAQGEVLGSMLYIPVVQDWLATTRLDFRFPPTRAAAIRAVQVKSHDTDAWHLFEMRIHGGGAELARDPMWRIHASPNPWDAREAFDNNRLTGWRSWEPMRPGMFVEVDFRAERRVDRVTIDRLPFEFYSGIEIEVRDSEGPWRRVPSKMVQYRIGAPMNLRGQATAVLRDRGITHIVLHEGDLMAKDMEDRQQDWGVAKIADRAGFRLYAIR
jgi:4-amino-4-deoxy-L-arabinose transferase-like glycosyltransferase